ncbi:hypothetical protein BVC93_12190 [Mycobacterium sp. MS1601]|uniref:LpqN/LpqT family lipoprotein n=1 Tax=Mycobacterium sp. MS1601 TaxID=1936029 RepID=UPI00097970EA|nr:LpqN/LpqT family lipoprotein [Mycobacterium sp. MS1601]AQA03066.1 hypothetical protein BVC93_12190 [Mycobacterium sp. MS1601]
MFAYVTGRVLAGGVAAGIAGVMGLAVAPASAEPAVPLPPVPTPATMVEQAGVAPLAPGIPAQPAAAAVAPQAQYSPQAQYAPQLQQVAAPALTPATSGTIREFLTSKGATLEPQNPRTFTALHITLPMPPGWAQVPDPNVPDAFAVIADRVGGDGLYTSNAQVVIYRVVGGAFDATEASTHGFIDSQQLPNWQSTDASLAPFGGFPSSLIEGTYQQNDMTLNTSRRHVLATSGTDTYLVSLSVTTAVSQVVAAADATEAIVNGFKVTAPTAAPAPPPATAP